MTGRIWTYHLRGRLFSTAVTTFLLLLLPANLAQAMEFSIRFHDGQRFIVGEGPIIEGDAGRLALAIPMADRDEFGNITLFLNSPGGSVDAAFELVKLMDRWEFSAIVGSEAICASACASILYISARFHQVVGSGRLGIHTCYSKEGKTGTAEPSAFCNEAIRENAVQHGTSYGAIKMWDDYAPADMAWFDSQIACRIGLCGPPVFERVLAIPSFNCRNAKLETEKLICADKRLSRHDASMAKAYADAMATSSSDEKARLRQTQREWLFTRNRCQGPDAAECVVLATDMRREALWKLITSKSKDQSAGPSK